mmetsp:Transcript_11133/g.26899  ORF Transcript_11133/g.26899 Transcript_11133/m.26899 type:complete len:119 (+) Transcript_11133:58-414(+)|eukprot:CAMPEP_0198337762 /NCGR_PEP_ID=MMETSP1450-20131203/31088_1 /TAXON_ID=753684 ORGANISM="Madagascaria erythrocladiodes, Strain CCMP3234" /NCGR_SAMPLE_ID=MMETSP1450 /ASSEMBLY_ACC=CAM_ASM_001115 /LENGTH=118 /DNA_ID=CAMNT_0044042595 /DNA_START=42 /DNA_END=398 /DNA_ORIENTATION=+
MSAAAGQATADYEIIIECIRQEGRPNEQFDGDIDLTYGELHKAVGHKIGGLPAKLNTLKQKKRIDFNNKGVSMSDDVVITMIGDADANAPVKTTQIAYEEIKSKVASQATAFQSTVTE